MGVLLFYWEGVFGAAQNVGRFWCRHPARLLWASGGHPRGQSRLIWVRQGPWVPYVEQAGRPSGETALPVGLLVVGQGRDGPPPLQPLHRARGQGGADADEEGTFRGMHDFLVRPSHALDETPRLMYRMHSTDNYLPETGRGALVIKRIPPGPPAMAKLAPKKEWALDKKLCRI
eukprot:scaffold3273_cov126-Isochrysis_galbana.AAC.1